MQPAAPPLIRRAFRLGERAVEIDLRDDSSSRLVVREIFKDGVYAPIPRIAPPRAVLDIGGHLGCASAYFRLAYPDAAIVCVEPDPASFAILSANAGRIGNCHAVNLGLHDHDGEAAFHSARISVLSSLLPMKYQGVAAETSQVRLRHAGAFADEACARLGLPGFDLIKIDTEGMELPILAALGDRVARAGVIHLEFHSHADRRAIDEALCHTHTLCHGRIERPDLGTLTYVATRLLAAPG